MPPTDRGPSLSNSTMRNRLGSEITASCCCTVLTTISTYAMEYISATICRAWLVDRVVGVDVDSGHCDVTLGVRSCTACSHRVIAASIGYPSARPTSAWVTGHSSRASATRRGSAWAFGKCSMNGQNREIADDALHLRDRFGHTPHELSAIPLVLVRRDAVVGADPNRRRGLRRGPGWWWSGCDSRRGGTLNNAANIRTVSTFAALSPEPSMSVGEESADGGLGRPASYRQSWLEVEGVGEPRARVSVDRVQRSAVFPPCRIEHMVETSWKWDSGTTSANRIGFVVQRQNPRYQVITAATDSRRPNSP